MKWLLSLCVALSLVPFTVGCESKVKTETKQTTTTPGGTTTTTDTHTVESKGDNPPPNNSGEVAK